MRTRVRTLLVLAGAWPALLAGLAASAQAATYTVGTTEDLTGVCGAPATEKCSLRQLIRFEDNGGSGEEDTIVVPPRRIQAHDPRRAPYRKVAEDRGRECAQHPRVRRRQPGVRHRADSSVQPTVAISGLEVSGGVVGESEAGGDIRNRGHLTLSEDWITKGTAGAGGGGVLNERGSLDIFYSLISNNHAENGRGGGIENEGCSEAESCSEEGEVGVGDSTVADNEAESDGGGISSSGEGSSGAVVVILDSTIAGNKTAQEVGGGAGGGIEVEGGTVDLAASIVAQNVAKRAGAESESNCAGSTIISSGYNLENTPEGGEVESCGFTSSGDISNVNPRFSSKAPQDNGGNTDTLAPEPSSPAVNAIPPELGQFCLPIDQRGVRRPQGPRCDIGAVELEQTPTSEPPPGPPIVANVHVVSLTATTATLGFTINPNGSDTTYVVEYGPSASYGQATEPVNIGATRGEQSLTHALTGLQPNHTYHFAVVATNALATAGERSADQPFTTPAAGVLGATFANLPPPVLGKTVNVEPVSGTVLIALPGAQTASVAAAHGVLSSALRSPLVALESLSKGLHFIPLTEARQVPVGSVLETTAGVAAIESATSKKGKLQLGDFGAGIFKMLQSRKQKGLTELDIIDAHAARQVCATVGKGARAAAHVSGKVLGRLNSSAHGKFSVRGQYSAATVRGTQWTVTNQCNGTLTKVKRGVVSVRDFRRRKTITLFTGQSYLAKAP